jgi:hypothetical protein
MNFLAQAQQCFQISSTTTNGNGENAHADSQKHIFANSNKFKNHIMEKYLRGLDDETNNNHNNQIINNNISSSSLGSKNNNSSNNNDTNINDNSNDENDNMDDDESCEMSETKSSPSDSYKKPELSKWLESTANFTPSKNNYNIDFAKNEKRKKNGKSSSSLCEKELLAAETLVLLKNNFRTKFYNS